MSAKTIVLITGSNSGVGFQTAAALIQASQDYHVYVCSRSLEKGKKAIAELEALKAPGSLSLLQLDVTDEATINEAVKTVEKDYGRLDVLINNAGLQCLTGGELEMLREIFEANTFGPLLMTSKFRPLLKKSTNARLLFVSSGLGSIGKLEQKSGMQPPAYGPYRMSKAALNMLMVHNYFNYGDWLKAWSICPGLVATNLGGAPKKLKEMGAGDSAVSAQTILGVVEGKRDGDVGKFVHKDGVYPW